MKWFSLIIICLIFSSFAVDFSVAFKTRLRSRLGSKSRSKSKTHKKLFENLKQKPSAYAGMDHTEVDTLRMKAEAAKLGLNDIHVSDGVNDNLQDNQYANVKSRKGNKPQDDFEINPHDFKFDLPDDLKQLEENAPVEKKRLKDLSLESEMERINVELEDWLSITSGSYANVEKYPGLADGHIHLNKNFTRINDKFISPFNTNGVPTPTSFWFKLNKKYIYYFESKNCTNSLGRIYLDEIQDARDLPRNYGCFSVIEREGNVSYKICAETNFVKRKWLCRLQEILGVEKSKICGGSKVGGDNENKFRLKKIITKEILIPLPSDKCNENWDYLKSGSDWQCKCVEGDNQSPIDLPPFEKAIQTAASPLFDYEIVPFVAEEDAANGLIKKGQNHKMFFRNGALRIYASSFGKVVTLDGVGYYADEIVFHTPSEHKIDGKTADMEVKIIHSAKTVGDYSKKLTLSFLFKRKPGAYNKFLDKLDFYNLPNPYDVYQDLTEDIFIPNIFLDEDIEGSGEMIPFSFYSYEGSITEPPCSENTLVLVASEPLFASFSTLQLFREALKKPDMMNLDGRIFNDSKNIAMTNRRRVQKQKGRAIFHYDKKLDCPFTYKHKSDGARSHGHYERVTRKASQYYFVDGEKPSMLPGAYVVTDAEAQGKMDPETRKQQEFQDEDEDDHDKRKRK